MGMVRKSIGILAAVVFCSATSAFAEDIDNPMYKNWAKFKPGTSVTMSTDMDMAGNKMNSKATTTLKEVTPEKVVVEMKMAEGMPGMAMEFKAKVPKPEGPAATAKAEAKTSTDEVEVSGKKYKCNVTETTSDTNGIKSVSKAWTSEDFPGMVIKSETTMSGTMSGTTKTSVTEVTIK